MKIGELSKLTGTSIQTIRYYEQENLLPEAPRNLENNYRNYNASHLERLNFIKHCRVLNMTHLEIRVLLHAQAEPSASCESINTLIDSHLLHVKKKIEELQFLESQLHDLRSRCIDIQETKDCGILQELAQNISGLSRYNPD